MEPQRRTADIVSGTIILGLSAWIVWDLRHLPFMTPVGPGASFVPYLLAGVWAVLAIILIIAGARPRADRSDSSTGLDAGESLSEDSEIDEGPTSGLRRFLRAGSVLAILTGSAVSAYFIGLVPALFVSSFLLMSCVERMRWLTSLIGAIGIASGIYGIFELALGVPLEHGFWG